MIENLMKINEQLLNYFNGFADNKIIWENIWFLADWPIFFLPIFMLWTWIFYTYKIKSNEKKIDLLFIFYWIVFSILISLLIQQFVHLDRPEQHLENWAKLLLNHIPDASFPSDHATVSFAFLTWLFLSWYKKIWYLFLPFVIVMNLARIIAWVHWPFDVLVWSLIWIFWMIFSFKFWKKIKILEKFNNFILKIMWYIKL